MLIRSLSSAARLNPPVFSRFISTSIPIQRNRVITRTKKVFKAPASTTNKTIPSTVVPIEEAIDTPPLPPPAAAAAASFPWTSYNSTPSEPPKVTTTDPSPSTSSTTTEVIESIPIALIPVEVPHDSNGVLDLAKGEVSEKVRKLFAVPAIVVARQLELMNLFIGFEEANKYQLLSPEGTLLGYLMEEDLGFKGVMMRQMLKTHRAFKATVLDTEGNVLLRIRRPFSWINSRIYVSIPSSVTSLESMNESEADEIVIGEAQQEWHLYRRKYNHFVKREDGMEQFASTDSGFLAWDFSVQNEKGETIGSVNRNFAGFGRELFTDTGQYVLRFEGAALENQSLPVLESPPSSTTSTTLDSLPIPPTSTPVSTALTNLPPLPSITYDQRAVLLASAISIDFDYFTRSRGGLMGGGGMGMWMPMPMGGLGGGGAGAAGEAGEVGEVVGGEGPLPSTDFEGGGGGGGGYNDVGTTNGSEGGWNETGDWNGGSSNNEAMLDPWASTEETGTGTGGSDEGTWSWGDLFPDE